MFSTRLFSAAGRLLSLLNSSGNPDPYFSNVSLLAHVEGTNGATTFTEQLGHAFTVGAGASTISTGAAKFGLSSLYHAASSYFTTPASTAFDITTGPFTTEAFIYVTAYNATQYNGLSIFSTNNGTSGWAFSLGNSGNQIVFQSYASGTYKDQVISNTFTPLSLNAWHHVAVSFDGTTYSFYADGVRYGTATSTGSVPAGGALVIGVSVSSGSSGYPGWQWTGYLDEMRITKGVGRYVGNNITVPTLQFPNAALSYLNTPGLTWAIPNASPLDVTPKTLPASNSYLSTVSLDGQTGWRLPTVAEIQSLVTTFGTPYLRSVGWPSTTYSWGWCGQSFNSNNNYVAAVDTSSQATGTPRGFSYANITTDTYPLYYVVK